jgi:hypothetical protein
MPTVRYYGIGSSTKLRTYYYYVPVVAHAADRTLPKRCRHYNIHIYIYIYWMEGSFPRFFGFPVPLAAGSWPWRNRTVLCMNNNNPAVIVPVVVDYRSKMIDRAARRVFQPFGDQRKRNYRPFPMVLITWSAVRRSILELQRGAQDRVAKLWRPPD